MTAQPPLIWYKDGGTNVGTLGSSGNFVQSNSQTTITSITGVSGATVNCIRVVPTTLPQLSATTTLPFNQTIPNNGAGLGVYAISFWFKLISTTKVINTALFSYNLNGVTNDVFLTNNGLSAGGKLMNFGSPNLWDSGWHFLVCMQKEALLRISLMVYRTGQPV